MSTGYQIVEQAGLHYVTFQVERLGGYFYKEGVQGYCNRQPKVLTGA